MKQIKLLVFVVFSLIFMTMVGSVFSWDTPYSHQIEQTQESENEQVYYMVIMPPVDGLGYDVSCLPYNPLEIGDEVDIDADVLPVFGFRVVEVTHCNFVNVYYDQNSGQYISMTFSGEYDEIPNVSVNWVEILEEDLEETAYGN